MKRTLTALLLLLITLPWASADEGAYTLPYVYIKGTVHENGEWEMAEGMLVDFSQPRHGIYKYIPSKFFYGFTMPNGSQKEYVYKNIIKDVSVTDRNFTWEEDETEAENAIIKIGDANRVVEGPQKYFIYYTVQYLSDRFDGEDFLCHTLWGSGWNTQVDTLDFEIQFDKEFPQGFAQQLHLYSGERGSTVNADSVAYEVNEAEHTIVGRVYNLPANHAITISAQLPEGYWKIPPKDDTSIRKNLLTMGLITLIYLLVMLGRRRKTPIQVVSFYPPDGISSAEVGKIIDDSTDTIDLASLIPWFAHKGYITITEIPDSKGRMGKDADLLLTKKVPLLPGAPEYQRRFMKAIFGDKKSVKLSNLGDRHAEMASAKLALDKKFAGPTKLTRTNGWAIFLWILVLVTASMVCGACTMLGDYLEEYAIKALFTAGLVPFFVGITRISKAAKLSFHGNTFSPTGIATTVVLSALGGAVYWYMFDEGILCYPVYYFMGFFAVVGLLSYVINFATADTDYRVSRMNELLGLRDFIKTAEQARLKMLVDENPSYFYDVLPYAIVMELSDKWVEQFSNIKFDNPDWYSSKDHKFKSMPASLIASSIATSVSRSINNAVAAASVDPTSSSSSGGYSGGGSSFSGGGGGGGGGGSW